MAKLSGELIRYIVMTMALIFKLCLKTRPWGQNDKNFNDCSVITDLASVIGR